MEFFDWGIWSQYREEACGSDSVQLRFCVKARLGLFSLLARMVQSASAVPYRLGGFLRFY